MKLLRLELENINSIYGNQSVDFVTELREAPLFLICGPTGAGKSTVLDAISLALFGCTPRLRNQSPREAREDTRPELALSRGTGYGRAQLTFRKSSPGEGPRRYRATWEVWRGNRRNPNPAGKVQGPYRRLDLMDEATGAWQPLADEYPNGRQEYQEVLRKVLEGFTLQDFTRCMLLAQGEFAAFLKATDADRAAILERLTRTEVYRKIGSRAAARLSAAKQDTAQARAGLGQVRLLDPEEAEALRSALGDHKLAFQTAQDEVGRIRAALAWFEGERGLLGEEAVAEARVDGARKDRLDASEDMAALGAFEEAGPALEALERAKVRRGEATDRAADLALVKATLATREAEITSGQARHEASRLRLVAAREALQALAPELAEARALRTLLGTARPEADGAQTAHKTALVALGKAEAAMGLAADTLRAEQGHLEAAEGRLAQAPWEGLAADLGGLEARIEALLVREDALEADGRGQARLEAELARDAQACAALEEAAAKASLDAKVLAGEAAACQRDLAVLLEGAPDAPEARRRLEQARRELGARLHLLEILEAKAEEAAKARTRAEDASRAHRDLQAKTELAQGARAEADATAEDAEKKVLAMDQTLELMRWARDLAQERGRLGEGSPCPLCGAIEHPALLDPAQGTRDAAVQAECEALAARLIKAKAAQDLARGEATRASRAADRAEAEATEAKRRAEALALECAGAEEGAKEAAKAAGLTGREDTPAGTLAAEEARLAALDGAHGTLERADQAFTLAREAAQAAHVRADRKATDFKVAEGRLKEKRERSVQEALRLEGTGSAFAVDLGALREVLAGHGLGQDLAAARQEARARVEAFRTALDRRNEARDRRDKAVTAEGAARQEHASAGRNEQVRRGEADLRLQALREAGDRVAGVLEGRDPDLMEASLGEAITAAEVDFGTRDRALQDLRMERDRALGAQVSAKDRVEAAARALADAEAALLPLLPPGGEAALEALALPQARARFLRERRDALATEGATAEALLAAVRGRQKTHREGRPEGLAPEAEAGLPAGLEAALEAQRGHGEAVGSARDRLKAQEEATLLYAKAGEKLREAQKEEDLWTRMAALIGTNDGEAFQKYAQVLNLQDLLARANVRMDKLRPRYHLVPAKDPDNADRLAFAIEDRDHACEVGPVNNLSGGEAFLVSLCLALALADYRTVRMPIETLLLDEGFGTLDRGTLGEVMGVLGSLTGAGTQVGIISHVESLQESALPRIRVEPLGMGRSRILVEGV